MTCLNIVVTLLFSFRLLFRIRFIHSFSYYCAFSSHLSYNKIYLKLTIVSNIKSGETFWTPCILVRYRSKSFALELIYDECD